MPQGFLPPIQRDGVNRAATAKPTEQMMEMETTQVPQIDISEASKTPDAKAHALTGDTMADLANIAKELGQSLDLGQEAADAQPQEPVWKTQERIAENQKGETQPVESKSEVEVPEKFQKPDGTPDAEKIEKSTQSLEQVIAKYKEKEREFSKLQNRVNNAPQAQGEVRLPQPLSPLEVQIAQDLMTESKLLGAPMSEGHAIATARVQAKMMEAKYNADMSITEDLRRRVEDTERTNELQGMINENPELLQDSMVDQLVQIRQAFPWVNNSQTPWRSAYIVLKGTQPAQQVKIATPKGGTVKAPATPVSPVARVTQNANPNTQEAWGMGMDDLAALIRKQNPSFKGK